MQIQDHIGIYQNPVGSDCIKWSQDNLLAVAAGQAITIFSPGALGGPRAFAPYRAIDTSVVGPGFTPKEWLDSPLFAMSAFYEVNIKNAVSDQGFRNIAWSPVGCTPSGGCYLAALSADFKVRVLAPPASYMSSNWYEVADVTKMYHDYMTANGWKEVDCLAGTAEQQQQLAAAAAAAEQRPSREDGGGALRLRGGCSAPPPLSAESGAAAVAAAERTAVLRLRGGGPARKSAAGVGAATAAPAPADPGGATTTAGARRGGSSGGAAAAAVVQQDTLKTEQESVMDATAAAAAASGSRRRSSRGGTRARGAAKGSGRAAAGGTASGGQAGSPRDGNTDAAAAHGGGNCDGEAKEIKVEDEDEEAVLTAPPAKRRRRSGRSRGGGGGDDDDDVKMVPAAVEGAGVASPNGVIHPNAIAAAAAPAAAAAAVAGGRSGSRAAGLARRRDRGAGTAVAVTGATPPPPPAAAAVASPLREGDRVEVHNEEEGLIGAWFPARLVKLSAPEYGYGLVMYDELQVSEDAGSPLLTEWFPLPGCPRLLSPDMAAALNGPKLEGDEGPGGGEVYPVHGRRGYAVRPVPPSQIAPSPVPPPLRLGMLLEVTHDAAWWTVRLVAVSGPPEAVAKAAKPSDNSAAPANANANANAVVASSNGDGSGDGGGGGRGGCNTSTGSSGVVLHVKLLDGSEAVEVPLERSRALADWDPQRGVWSPVVGLRGGTWVGLVGGSSDGTLPVRPPYLRDVMLVEGDPAAAAAVLVPVLLERVEGLRRRRRRRRRGWQMQLEGEDIMPGGSGVDGGGKEGGRKSSKQRAGGRSEALRAGVQVTQAGRRLAVGCRTRTSCRTPRSFPS